jgi:type I restriction enzyme S subunit
MTQEFKKTEIGMIPEDWNIGELKNLCGKIGSGATPRGGSNVYIDSGITFIRSQNVYDEGFKTEGLTFIRDPDAKKLENVEVKLRI